MNSRQKNIIYGGTGLVILVGLIWYGNSIIAKSGSGGTVNHSVNQTLTNLVVDQPVEPTHNLPSKALITDVPFTSQAPTADWKDDRQQNDCEEASVLIATKWLKGEAMGNKEDILAELLTLSHLAETMFGTYVDSSAADTLKLFQKYNDTTVGKVNYGVTITDIKKELAANHILLMPMDGQALDNPNFTAGGPERHFIVVIGYDDKTGMFTTNDPGTRNGKNYRYKYETLIAAMRDYPTGDHAKIASNVRAMIAISKT
jgi:hypothetical protein